MGCKRIAEPHDCEKVITCAEHEVLVFVNIYFILNNVLFILKIYFNEVHPLKVTSSKQVKMNYNIELINSILFKKKNT